MKRIVLLCNSGLSTGIPVKKMKAAVEAQDFTCKISAAPVSDAEAVEVEADLILLGLQARLQMETVKKQVACPMTSTGPMSYGTVNGEEVSNQAKKELGEAWWRIWN